MTQTPLTRKRLAVNLATSLASQDWSQQTLEAVLRRRLPPALHRLSQGISLSLMEQRPGRYAPSAKEVAKLLLWGDDFDRMYRYCARRKIWPDPVLTAPQMAPIAAFADLPLPQLPTVQSLAEWLAVPLDRLDYLADLHNRYEQHDEMAVNHYHIHLLAKKSGGHRVIEAPKSQLKRVQRQILTGILDALPLHRDCFGFAKQRNCLDGANRHCGEEVVLCFDLQEFFPSIRQPRVFGLFRCLGYPWQVARYLTALCTTVTPPRVLARLEVDQRLLYRQPHLPQGSPASPALANHLAHRLDKRLSGLARCLDANYSRYADDLSFSGDRHITAALMRAVPDIVRAEGFRLKPTKTRVQTRSMRQVVTGVVVNDHLNISRDQCDRFKAIIHACGAPDDLRLNDPAFCASLIGQLDWVERVNPHRGQKLKRQLDMVLQNRTDMLGLGPQENSG